MSKGGKHLKKNLYDTKFNFPMTNVMFSCILHRHALDEYIKFLKLKASTFNL